MQTLTTTSAQQLALSNISPVAISVADVKLALSHADRYDENQHKIGAMKAVGVEDNNNGGKA